MKRFIYIAILVAALAGLASACNCGKPTSPDMIMKLAEKRIEYGDYDKAVTYVERAIKKYGPDTSRAVSEISRLGYCYLMMGQYDIALEKFGVVLQNEPNNLDAHIYSGKAYLYSYRFDQALAQFGDAMAIDPRVGEMLEVNHELHGFLQGHDTGDFRDRLNQIIAPHSIPDVRHSQNREHQPQRAEDSSL